MTLYLYSLAPAMIEAGGETFLLPAKNPCSLCPESDVFFNFPPPYKSAKYFRAAPKFSKNLHLIELYDGLLLIPALRRERSEAIKTISEKSVSMRGENFLFSLVSDGGYALKVRSAFGERAWEIPFAPEKMEIFPHSSFPVFLVVVRGKKTAAVAVDATDSETLFFTVCDKIETGKTVVATSAKADIMRHVTTDEWKISKPFEPAGRKVISRRASPLPHELIPYAFLEEVAVQGDYSKFLSPELKPRASLIPEFLGDFDIYLPPCNENYPSLIALISTKKNKARYLRLVSDDLIRDLTVENYPF